MLSVGLHEDECRLKDGSCPIACFGRSVRHCSCPSSRARFGGGGDYQLVQQRIRRDRHGHRLRARQPRRFADVGEGARRVLVPKLVFDYLDVPVLNSAVPDKVPVNIACRVGALRPKLAVVGGTLRADASRVSATLTSGEASKAGSAGPPYIGAFTGRYLGVGGSPSASAKRRATPSPEHRQAASRLAYGGSPSRPARASAPTSSSSGQAATTPNDLVAGTKKMVGHNWFHQAVPRSGRPYWSRRVGRKRAYHGVVATNTPLAAALPPQPRRLGTALDRRRSRTGRNRSDHSGHHRQVRRHRPGLASRRSASRQRRGEPGRGAQGG